MIISHKHKFIFLRTKKTASTSTSVALSAVCGPADVISPELRTEESLKAEMGYKSGQHYYLPLQHWTMKDAAKFVLRRRRPKYARHMRAASLKRRIDSRTFHGYFKFCVERNPYDRALSLYYWRTRNMSEKPSLVSFLRSLDTNSLSNYYIYSINGAVSVDHIVRYEALAKELEAVTLSLGITDRIRLPRFKSEYRLDRVHYSEVMVDEAREIVEKACSREIALLGYEFSSRDISDGQELGT